MMLVQYICCVCVCAEDIIINGCVRVFLCHFSLFCLSCVGRLLMVVGFLSDHPAVNLNAYVFDTLKRCWRCRRLKDDEAPDCISEINQDFRRQLSSAYNHRLHAIPWSPSNECVLFVCNQTTTVVRNQFQCVILCLCYSDVCDRQTGWPAKPVMRRSNHVRMFFLLGAVGAHHNGYDNVTNNFKPAFLVSFYYTILLPQIVYLDTLTKIRHIENTSSSCLRVIITLAFFLHKSNIHMASHFSACAVVRVNKNIPSSSFLLYV